jgi:hypothetical protein
MLQESTLTNCSGMARLMAEGVKPENS